MITSLKNVLIVDGSGWIPFLGDVVLKDDKVEIVSSGEDCLYDIDSTFDIIDDYEKSAYVIPGFDSPMTMEKYQNELDTLRNEVKSGKKIEKAVRALTGYGVGQREYLLAGKAADVFVADEKLENILAAYADGKKL